MHRLALKLAAVVAGGVAGPALALSLALPAGPWWQALVWGTLAGGVAYVAAYGLLARRLELARSTLKQIRKHRFESLEAVQTPGGDELNALIWQVYRTGLTLEKEIRELKKMENYRREFLGNVSHELKTPIFAIQGFSETLLDGGLDDQRFNRSFVEKILRNAGRLGNLADDLAEISKIETGELKMRMAPFNVERLIEEVVESLEPMAQANTLDLQAHFSDRLPPVQGDRERIRQVLINLVDNAVKYNNPGGRVEVVARRLPAGEVKISVVDNGIGVAPYDIPRLTERFFRADKSRSRAQGGTGLGLAIVKHILGAHARRLVVESTPGTGSTFGFTLPVAEAVKEAAVVERAG